VHRKVYLPTYGMFDEDRYFTRGDRVQAFESRFGRMAILICEDLWHVSVPYLAALDGARVLLCPATAPPAESRVAGWTPRSPMTS